MAIGLGKAGLVPKLGKEAEDLLQQRIVERVQGEIVCSVKYCYMHLIYLLMFLPGYPI